MVKRVTWIDVAKCFGIILVIFNHFNVDYGQSTIKIVIASFHMPLFFVLAGMIASSDAINVKEYFNYSWNRFLRIMVPYYLWAFIYCNGVNARNILYILWASNRTLSAANSNAVLWFLPCYFLSSLMVRAMLSYLSSKQFEDKLKPIFIACSSVLNFILGGVLSSSHSFLPQYDFPLSLNVVFIANGFMLLGYLTKMYLKKKDCYTGTISIKIESLVAVVSFIGVVIFALLNTSALNNYWGRVVMARSLFGNYVLFIASAIFGSILIGCLSRIISSKETIISRIGKETLSILAIHIYIISIIERFINNISTKSWYTVLIVAGLSIIVLFISYYFARIIRRVAPNLAGGNS